MLIQWANTRSSGARPSRSIARSSMNLGSQRTVSPLHLKFEKSEPTHVGCYGSSAIREILVRGISIPRTKRGDQRRLPFRTWA